LLIISLVLADAFFTLSASFCSYSLDPTAGNFVEGFAEAAEDPPHFRDIFIDEIRRVTWCVDWDIERARRAFNKVCEIVKQLSLSESDSESESVLDSESLEEMFLSLDRRCKRRRKARLLIVHKLNVFYWSTRPRKTCF